MVVYCTEHTYSFYIWQTAIPILIGTKFDDFAQLPLEMQWTIVNDVQQFSCDQNIDHFLSLRLGSRAFCISNVTSIERGDHALVLMAQVGVLTLIVDQLYKVTRLLMWVQLA
jgi:hypothetical protein